MAFLKKVFQLGVPVCLMLTAISCQRTGPVSSSFEDSARPVLEKHATGSRDPKLSITASGMLSMLTVYREGGTARLGLTMSHDSGDHFMPIIPISQTGAEVSSHGENSPSLAASPTVFYALWEQQSKLSTDLMVARSFDYGHSFLPPVRVTDRDSASFHGFSSLGVAPNEDVYVAWLDGREKDTPPGTFSLYIARSKDKGASFEKNRRIALSACPCCRPRIAFGPKGEVYVAWRKDFPGDIRDMVVSVSRDGGKTFEPESHVAEDGWVLRGCPDSGPALTVVGNRLYIAWLTEGHEHRPRIQVSWSDDGKVFHSPVIASGDTLDPNHPALIASENGTVWLAFQGRKHGNSSNWTPSAVFVAKMNGEQVSSPEQLPNNGETAMYPSLVAGTAGRLFVAWTRNTDNGNDVLLVRGRSAINN